MSEIARIGIYENGAVKSIYLHNDGYIEHAGEILHTYYNTREEINRLIMLGDLSILESEIGVKTNFYVPNPDQCVAYHRDRGEDLNIRASDEKNLRDWEDYNYLFKDNKWYVSCSETNFQFEPLENYL